MKTLPINLLTMLVIVLAASSCSQRKPIDINEDVRAPSEHEDSIIQVAPMVPEAIKILIAESETQVQNGAHNQALLTLKRALSISPTSSLVQQHLAEVYLAEGAYQQAFEWSEKVTEKGPTHGPLCERAYRTLALAAEMLNDVFTQSEALEHIARCTQKIPEKY